MKEITSSLDMVEVGKYKEQAISCETEKVLSICINYHLMCYLKEDIHMGKSLFSEGISYNL